MIVAWPGCPLDALVGAQIEVEFSGVSDANVYSCPGRDVPGSSRLFLEVSAKESSVMSLLHHDESYTRFVIRLQFDTGFTDSCQLML